MISFPRCFSELSESSSGLIALSLRDASNNKLLLSYCQCLNICLNVLGDLDSQIKEFITLEEFMNVLVLVIPIKDENYVLEAHKLHMMTESKDN